MKATIHSYAAEGNVEGIRRELRRGVSIDALDDDNCTPLMVAAVSKEATPETLKAIIELGANVNELVHETCKDLDRSVLSYCARLAPLEKIQVLIEARADVRYVDPNGYSILLSALHRHVLESAAVLHQIANALIQAGAPLDAASKYNETAIGVASYRADLTLIQLLLDAGADPAPLKWNELFHAVAFDDVAKVRSLVEGGMPLEQKDRWHRTPLLLAIHTGRLEIAKYLVSAGSDLRARNHVGQTGPDVRH